MEDDTEKRELDLAKHFDTAPELLSKTSHRPKMAALVKDTAELDPATEQNVQKKQRKAYKQLSQRINRERQLRVIGNAPFLICLQFPTLGGVSIFPLKNSPAKRAMFVL